MLLTNAGSAAHTKVAAAATVSQAGCANAVAAVALAGKSHEQ